MNKKEWESSSVKERAAFLLGAELKVKKQSGVDPKSKVGDCSVITVFAVFADIVQISDWHVTTRSAMQQAITVLDIWEKKLNK